MDSGHRDNGDGERGAHRDQNVVRLPREWLGPLDELVPISTTARGRAEDALAGSAEAPPSASAFWSADSAALHDAVQAPTSQPAPSAASPPPVPATLPGPRTPRLRSGRPRRLLAARRRYAAAVVAVLIGLGGAAVAGWLDRPAAGMKVARLSSSDHAGKAKAARGSPAQLPTMAQDTQRDMTISALDRAASAQETRRHHLAGHAPAARRPASRVARTGRSVTRAPAHHVSSPSTASGPAPTEVVSHVSVQEPPTQSPTQSAASTVQAPSPAVTTVTTVQAPAQLAGPSGPGGAIGGNCNPKCQ